MELLEETKINISSPVLWVGDFNVHNALWRSTATDRNGQVLEDFVDKYDLVVLNNECFRTIQNAQSSIDITLAFTSM